LVCQPILLQAVMGPLADPEITGISYKEIVKFKGDIQTRYLPKNESLYRDKENNLRL
jgi:hypothetical protein